jgi:hypothetical protein
VKLVEKENGKTSLQNRSKSNEIPKAHTYKEHLKPKSTNQIFPGTIPTTLNNTKVQGGYSLFDRFHGSALHGDRCTAYCEAHTNFADES